MDLVHLTVRRNDRELTNTRRVGALTAGHYPLETLERNSLRYTNHPSLLGVGRFNVGGLLTFPVGAPLQKRVRSTKA